jgi:hypothetical protein
MHGYRVRLAVAVALIGPGCRSADRSAEEGPSAADQAALIDFR